MQYFDNDNEIEEYLAQKKKRIHSMYESTFATPKPPSIHDTTCDPDERLRLEAQRSIDDVRVSAALFHKLKVADTLVAYFSLIGLLVELVYQESFIEVKARTSFLSKMQYTFGELLGYVQVAFTLSAAVALYARYDVLLRWQISKGSFA